MQFYYLLYFNEIQILLFHKTAFHIAVEKGDIEIVKILLENLKLDVNFRKIYN